MSSKGKKNKRESEDEREKEKVDKKKQKSIKTEASASKDKKKRPAEDSDDSAKQDVSKKQKSDSSKGNKHAIKDAPSPTTLAKLNVPADSAAARLQFTVVDESNKEAARKTLTEKFNKGNAAQDYNEAYHWKKQLAAEYMSGWQIQVQEVKGNSNISYNYSVVDHNGTEVDVYHCPLVADFCVIDGLGVLGEKTASDTGREFKIKLNPTVMYKGVTDKDPTIADDIKLHTLWMAAARIRIGQLLWECDSYESAQKDAKVDEIYSLMTSMMSEEKKATFSKEDPRVTEAAMKSWLVGFAWWDDDVDDTIGKDKQKKPGNSNTKASKADLRQRPKKQGVCLRFYKKVFAMDQEAIDKLRKGEGSSGNAPAPAGSKGSKNKTGGKVNKTSARVEDIDTKKVQQKETDADRLGGITDKNSMGLVTDEKVALAIIMKAKQEGFSYLRYQWKDATAKWIEPAKGESPVMFKAIERGDVVQLRSKFHIYRLNNGARGCKLKAVGYGVLFRQGISPGAGNTMKPIESAAAAAYVRREHTDKDDTRGIEEAAKEFRDEQLDEQIAERMQIAATIAAEQKHERDKQLAAKREAIRKEMESGKDYSNATSDGEGENREEKGEEHSQHSQAEESNGEASGPEGKEEEEEVPDTPPTPGQPERREESGGEEN